jgi:DNA gyrase subunit B
MYELVRQGHVYVAQPPLFRVKSKKDVYYVQTEEEMKAQLLENGLKEGEFEPDGIPGDQGGRVIKGAEMAKLARTLAAMEDSLIALERRGISLRAHAVRQDPVTLKLPIYHVYLGSQEHWFTRRDELDDFVAQHEEETGEEVSIGGDPTSTPGEPAVPSEGEPKAALPATAPGEEKTNGHAKPGLTAAAKKLHIVELHEVRSINTLLGDLAQMGFDIQSLIPQERTGTEEPRYTMRRGENSVGLEDLRGLLGAIRSAGEKGLSITRFKGLGEMNAEELRDTTLDPTNRTLLQITMDDLSGADTMFRTSNPAENSSKNTPSKCVISTCDGCLAV